MPAGDRTGPMGMGPMTGRAAGFCAGYGVPGYTNPVGGRGLGWGRGGGWGRGRGFGRGWRNAYQATGLPGFAPAWPGYAPAAPTVEQERDALKAQAESLTQALEDIKGRMSELEAAQKSKE